MRLRQAAGTDACDHITRIGPDDGDIPADRGLYVEISTGCRGRGKTSRTSPGC
ncbi:hypothetical protein OHS18_04530 [Amycolatopsis sp. NBC_00355]|uniref:hypothetical protein n=1 Tax=Amycolatopsis sp. NBC_00355 TaxID=2975957 RepID=UPI002E26913F